MSKRILLVVTNVDHYDADPSHPTGLWLSELTHAYDIFESGRSAPDVQGRSRAASEEA